MDSQAWLSKLNLHWKTVCYKRFFQLWSNDALVNSCFFLPRNQLEGFHGLASKRSVCQSVSHWLKTLVRIILNFIKQRFIAFKTLMYISLAVEYSMVLSLSIWNSKILYFNCKRKACHGRGKLSEFCSRSGNFEINVEIQWEVGILLSGCWKVLLGFSHIDAIKKKYQQSNFVWLIRGENKHPTQSVKITLQSVKSQRILFNLVCGNPEEGRNTPEMLHNMPFPHAIWLSAFI